MGPKIKKEIKTMADFANNLFANALTLQTQEVKDENKNQANSQHDNK